VAIVAGDEEGGMTIEQDFGAVLNHLEDYNHDGYPALVRIEVALNDALAGQKEWERLWKQAGVSVMSLQLQRDALKAALRDLVEACEAENEYEGRGAPSDSILGQARQALKEAE
jgi:hypothetical protein